MVGRIVTVSATRGFAWVRASGLDKDAFLHCSQLLLPEGVAFTSDLKGRHVDFIAEENDRGPVAMSARLMTED